MALGNKAIRDGKEEEAATHLRQAIDLYARQTESAGPLNNGALAYFSLFRVTGEREALDKGIAMMEKAVLLEPKDSILLGNTAHSVLEGAVRDIIGPAIDFKALKMTGSLELLSHLYKDQAGRDRYVQQVRRHAGIAKALAYYDRVLVLAPKNAHAYEAVTSIRSIHATSKSCAVCSGVWRRRNRTFQIRLVSCSVSTQARMTRSCAKR